MKPARTIRFLSCMVCLLAVVPIAWGAEGGANPRLTKRNKRIGRDPTPR